MRKTPNMRPSIKPSTQKDELQNNRLTLERILQTVIVGHHTIRSTVFTAITNIGLPNNGLLALQFAC